MSNRERWIIYPLLFLTLGIAMRDKIVPPRLKAREVVVVSAGAPGAVTADVIRCKHLEIVDRDKTPRVRMGITAQQAGVVEILKKDQQQAVVLAAGGEKGCGCVAVFGESDKPVVAISCDRTGKAGIVETANTDGRIQCQLRSTEFGGAVLTFDPEGHVFAAGRLGPKMGIFMGIPGLPQLIDMGPPFRFDRQVPPNENK